MSQQLGSHVCSLVRILALAACTLLDCSTTAQRRWSQRNHLPWSVIGRLCCCHRRLGVLRVSAYSQGLLIPLSCNPLCPSGRLSPVPASLALTSQPAAQSSLPLQPSRPSECSTQLASASRPPVANSVSTSFAASLSHLGSGRAPSLAPSGRQPRRLHHPALLQCSCSACLAPYLSFWWSAGGLAHRHSGASPSPHLSIDYS